MDNLDDAMDNALRNKLRGHQMESPRDLWSRIEAEMDAGEENSADTEDTSDTEAFYQAIAITV
ncbi:MAG: hypothetical protein HKN79_05820 [Flavobacteriales bacterium]|nr:hypothetical protein [Flavobacteriales bacterium]